MNQNKPLSPKGADKRADTAPLCTRWPLNMRLTRYDTRAGERALAESDLFCSRHLRLLCGVRLCDISPAQKGKFPREKKAPQGLFDYLVCKDSAVIMAIHVRDNNPWYGTFCYVPHLPAEEIPGWKFARGQVTELLTALEAILRQRKETAWYCRLQPCPPELADSMSREILLETQSDGSTVPTEYGMCCGLVRVLRSGSSCAMSTAQALADLKEYLKTPPVCRNRGQVPFDQLLQAYHSGLSRSERANMELVQAVMRQPLSAYMAEFPEEMINLHNSLPGECGTYGEAALAISRRLHASDNETCEEALDLMRTLAAPILAARNPSLAAQLGRQSAGRPPECASDGRRSIRRSKQAPLSFQERIAALQVQPSAGMLLASVPQASFFQGVGMLARSWYPQWRSNILRDYLELSGRTRYADLLFWADSQLMEDSFRAQRVGIRLLYLLLIEPYCLISYKQPTSKKGD